MGIKHRADMSGRIMNIVIISMIFGMSLGSIFNSTPRSELPLV